MESDYTTEGSDIEDEEHHLDEVVDVSHNTIATCSILLLTIKRLNQHLDVIDPEVAMVSHLSNAANSILIPRLPIYSRRPIVTLPTLTPTDTLENLVEKDEPTDTKEKLKSKFKRHHKDQDELDAHVAHVLKRRAKIRRTARGIWQFLKTPAGIVVGLYGFAVGTWSFVRASVPNIALP
ncbi:hypothetical protein DL93DRAFT_402871 [Clavulina sp. PMI_390]|nr:hypothetical protein DL93DRAFT_402871 [Clavulina sp. PMI_390]